MVSSAVVDFLECTISSYNCVHSFCQATGVINQVRRSRVVDNVEHYFPVGDELYRPSTII